MDITTHVVALADGRQLEVGTLGDPSGRTVVFHHGTPGSVLLARPLAEALARDAGVYVVTTSRAGYGRSTRHEGRTVASVVDDTRAVLDALGRKDYVAVGWSGGGPHAFACAALDAPRCVGVVSLAGVVPTDLDFDWTAGMGEANIEEFRLAQIGGPEYEASVATAGEEFRSATIDNLVEIFHGLWSPPDVTALDDEALRSELAEAFAYGFVESWRGFYDDDRAMLQPWGFSPTEITVPSFVYYGTEDFMVPATHGDWLVANIPGATKRRYEGEGHLSVVTKNLSTLVADVTSLLA